MAIHMGISRPASVGVAADDQAVDNGNEVPVKKRHTLYWLGR